MRLVPSEDTLQRVLPLLLPLVGPEGAVQCLLVCKSWRSFCNRAELCAVAGRCAVTGRCFCDRTVQLCAALAGGGDAEHLLRNLRRRLNVSTDDDAGRALRLEGGAFRMNSLGWKGNLYEWLQAASQEPDASFLSRGAASTALSLGLQLVEWVGKPQGRSYAHTLPGHSDTVHSVALSRDGKRAASGSRDAIVKIWNAETGAEVSSLE